MGQNYNAYIEEAENTYQKRDFTSQDWDKYIKRIIPYQRKVFQQKELLTPKDLQDIESIEEELLNSYTEQTLLDYRIFGEISTITSIDHDRKMTIFEQKIEKEYDRLLTEYNKKKSDGTLTKEYEDEFFKRTDQIKYTLDPWHFHGTYPS